jgi:hypothetical protein
MLIGPNSWTSYISARIYYLKGKCLGCRYAENGLDLGGYNEETKLTDSVIAHETSEMLSERAV